MPRSLAAARVRFDAPLLFATLVACLTAALLRAAPARAEDGYDLWLRYRPVEAPALARYRAAASELVVGRSSPTLDAARSELERGLSGLLAEPSFKVDTGVDRDGAVVLGTPQSSPLIAGLNLPLGTLKPEGYLIRTVRIGGRRATVIAARTDAGVLYGAFRFLSLIQTRRPVGDLDLASSPKLELRVIDHWDNLNGAIERGYAGRSLWDWGRLPDHVDPRMTDYARAEASIGVNGVVLNNVNASPAILTRPYLEKVAALASTFRPWGVRVYLSVNFASPMVDGGLKTADPLDPAVRAWWKAKADEIWALIPDFGGFLVKANSEGQPGPQDFGRSHADGANMLAEAVAPHGGVIMWRAFVYSSKVPDDRAKQAWTEFMPFDGKFAPNVLVQIKNGPIDFQPREPFSPLFGALKATPEMLEVQITKEYLGQGVDLAYLGPLYEEALRSDTFARGPGSTVAKVIEGKVWPAARTGMAGVANTGDDRNWSGSDFDQANWYVYGRLAWDPDASAREIAEDWARMTFSNDPRFVGPVVEMMMRSREAVVDYMTPLGLHHQMARDTHYGPGPWVSGGPRPDWTSTYFNRADANGIGFDRTSKGSDAVAQYAPEVRDRFEHLATTPDEDLLWFHHLPWTYRMRSGRTLWDELVVRYTEGVEAVVRMRATWAEMKPWVDPERFAAVSAKLAEQQREAQWWRDASLAYFESKSHLPFPKGYAPPPHPLAYYEARLTPPDDLKVN
jgi:alpha-glucuronidase